MGMLLPGNLKKKPMNVRHILHVPLKSIVDKRVCRPEAETRMISMALSLEKALIRSIP